MERTIRTFQFFIYFLIFLQSSLIPFFLSLTTSAQVVSNRLKGPRTSQSEEEWNIPQPAAAAAAAVVVVTLNKW